MSDKAYVTVLPSCDLCRQAGEVTEAHYDGALRIHGASGPWANMCEEHWTSHGIGRLGTGFGQRLIVGERDRHTEFNEALERGAWDELEDIIGDGDIADYL